MNAASFVLFVIAGCLGAYQLWLFWIAGKIAAATGRGVRVGAGWGIIAVAAGLTGYFLL